MSKHDHPSETGLLARLSAAWGADEVHITLQRVLEPILPALEQVGWLLQPMWPTDDYAADQSSPPTEGE